MLSTSAPPADSDPVVSLRGVGKSFTMWKNSSAQLFALLGRMVGRARAGSAQRIFTALHPIDLDIARGECLGIIGRNGAGKSTLLQIIAGTLRASSGHLITHGRVAALLELGSGFNPDFTGRENIHLNATILGLTKAEITAKFDSIVAYSGIEEFIDQPVHTYSSGMTLRLAFSVCVHVDADILIIDEALAVGDARFQFKCHSTLDQMLKEGRTIIFVSHDTNAVKRMCRTAILLERGELLLRGTPNDVTNVYTKLITSPHGVESIREDIAALGKVDAGSVSNIPEEPITELMPATLEATRLLTDERAHQQVSDKEYSYGGEFGRISTVNLTDDRGEPRLSFIAGNKIRVRIECLAHEQITDPIYAVTIKNVSGQEIFGTNTFFQNQTPPSVAAGETVEAFFDLQLNIQPGVYFISLGWVRLVNGEVVVIQRRYDVLRFDVLPRDKSFGIAYCPALITVRPPSRPSLAP